YAFDAATNTTTLLREYVWLEGVPVAMVDGATNEVFLIRTDHIGRPIFATDTSGVKVWEASYLPFGGVHVSTGATSDLRFPGQWFQSESGLHQNWMREYDPTTGRYIQADPLGLVDGASVYGYALQNPGRYTDPTGEFIPIIIAAASGFSAGYFGFQTGHELGQMIFGDQCVSPEDMLNFLPTIVPGGSVAKNLAKNLRNNPKGLGNPFKNKTAEQIDTMFKKKGFDTSGDAFNGNGAYVNPRNKRSYHIDRKEWGSHREPNHIDVNRLRPYKGSLSKKKLPFKE
ncbi:RHS repeat-associated core domain-containing protein, partial [Sulfitobacter sp. HNIBRBA2951]|uniref:RHS repeat-associated core domain-containing protein n=1 Tax=Sulfitobacter aquimarinus TaxID=3158557 RepID=UPI0032DFE933